MAEEDDVLQDLPSEDLTNNSNYSRLSGRQICIPESLPGHNASVDSDGSSADRPPRLAERMASEKALVKKVCSDEAPKMARQRSSARSSGNNNLLQHRGYSDSSDDFTIDEEKPFSAGEGNPLNSREEIAMDQPPRMAVRMASNSRGLSST